MSIQENIKEILKSIPNDVTLVAVSKTKPVSDLMEAYNAGQRVFGENKIQEMADKFEIMPKDIKWHMIGHVQTNKIKYMAPFVSLVHGVDKLNTLKEIDKQAKNNNRVIDCLLQIKIADEDTKFGMSADEASKILQSREFSELKNVCVMGVMGMATFTDNENQILSEFSYLKTTFDTMKALKTENFKPEILSMGMSGDFKLAIEQGSNMIRVGSLIFGERH